VRSFWATWQIVKLLFCLDIAHFSVPDPSQVCATRLIEILQNTKMQPINTHMFLSSLLHSSTLSCSHTQLFASHYLSCIQAQFSTSQRFCCSIMPLTSLFVTHKSQLSLFPGHLYVFVASLCCNSWRVGIG